MREVAEKPAIHTIYTSKVVQMLIFTHCVDIAKQDI